MIAASAMSNISAGILIYRWYNKKLQVLLLHPGGPYWVNKEVGAWSIPKGEPEPGEDELQAAIRETAEETGLRLQGDFIQLSPAKQKTGKLIYAWALNDIPDIAAVKSNLFEIEWPPKSGRRKSFPEIDKAAWFDIDTAKEKIVSGQIPFLIELKEMLNR